MEKNQEQKVIIKRQKINIIIGIVIGLFIYGIGVSILGAYISWQDELENKAWVKEQLEKQVTYKNFHIVDIKNDKGRTLIHGYDLNDNGQRFFVAPLEVDDFWIKVHQGAYGCLLPNLFVGYSGEITQEGGYIYGATSAYKEGVLFNKHCETDGIETNLQYFIDQQLK